MNPSVVLALSFFMGAGFTIAGVYLLAGPGWAFITCGVAWLIVCGVLIRGVRGLSNGG